MNLHSSTDPAWLENTLAAIPRARIAVFGDFCLDAYWQVENDEAELSVETGLPVRRVREQRYGLGGAGNVCANLAALGAGKVHAVGLMGNDLFGGCMLALMTAQGIETSGMLRLQPDWQTQVYSKPMMGDRELNRLDFGALNRISHAALEALIADLEKKCAACDAVVLNQQLPFGQCTEAAIDRINATIARFPKVKFLVDSRHRAPLFRGAILKLNSNEALRMLGDSRPSHHAAGSAEARAAAPRVFALARAPVFVTRGDRGILVADSAGLHEVPGIQIVERTDPVGAGDTVVAALAAVLASGGDCATAALFANIAASVTVRKLKTTGVATPAEIRAVGPLPDYLYEPELAEDPRPARYLPDSRIEVVRDLPASPRIRHAIFDHDGTISVLREGWEVIMEPLMAEAILGPRYREADEGLYRTVITQVRRFIDQTTGLQTLVQMQGLAAMVREYGFVAEKDILDMHGYKAVYNERLLAMVRGRVERLRRGELDPADFQIKGARAWLEALHRDGVKLHLASGTDTADVMAEAEALGYAGLFEGRIFGATDDIKVEAKKVVLERIIAENSLAGPDFAVFGDGPVEMREARKRGGIAVGLASDEVRRWGLSPAKRTRLIRAGADLIIEDWSQPALLRRALGLSPA